MREAEEECGFILGTRRAESSKSPTGLAWPIPFGLPLVVDGELIGFSPPSLLLPLLLFSLFSSPFLSSPSLPSSIYFDILPFGPTHTIASILGLVFPSFPSFLLPALLGSRPTTNFSL